MTVGTKEVMGMFQINYKNGQHMNFSKIQKKLNLVKIKVISATLFLWYSILTFIEGKNWQKNRATFMCNECEKVNKNIFAVATVEVIDSEDRSKDIYT